MLYYLSIDVIQDVTNVILHALTLVLYETRPESYLLCVLIVEVVRHIVG